MQRWRIKSSRRTATWFNACEVDFVEAPDADTAKSIVEGRSNADAQIEVWAVTPATEAMETRHQAWLEKRAALKQAAAQ